MSNEQRPQQPSNLVFGIILLVIGAGLLLGYFGWGDVLELRNYYPVLLLTLGVWGLIRPSRHLDRSAAVWVLGSGIYCLFGVYDLLGLGWGGAWPIFIIAAGVSVILHRHDSFCAGRGRLRNG
jgi:hypothetical protein